MNKLAKLQPWERQEDEASDLFSAFVVYRDMGPSRSLDRVAQATATPLSTTKSRSSTYDWKSRCSAYDRHLDSIRVAAVESDEQARAKASRDAVTLLGTATILELTKLVRDVREMSHSSMKVSELIKATECIVALQRLLDGEVTSRVEVATVSYENLTDDDLAILEAIANKIEGAQ